MLPVYVEHEPVLTVLPGASTSGAAAGHARAIAHRLENVLVASAILLGARSSLRHDRRRIAAPNLRAGP